MIHSTLLAFLIVGKVFLISFIMSGCFIGSVAVIAYWFGYFGDDYWGNVRPERTIQDRIREWLGRKS